MVDNYDEKISNEVVSIDLASNFRQNLGDNVLDNDLMLYDITQEMEQIIQNMMLQNSQVCRTAHLRHVLTV